MTVQVGPARDRADDVRHHRAAVAARDPDEEGVEQPVLQIRRRHLRRPVHAVHKG